MVKTKTIKLNMEAKLVFEFNTLTKCIKNARVIYKSVGIHEKMVLEFSIDNLSAKHLTTRLVSELLPYISNTPPLGLLNG